MGSKIFSVRLSEKDYEVIQKKASKANLSMGGYMVTAALGKEIIRIEGLDAVIRELKGIGRNLNQITMLCNTGKIKAIGLTDIKQQFTVANELLESLGRRSIK